VVGITGTNGKSTTTALVHHMLQSAALPVAHGRQHRPADPGQEPLPPGGVYVLELSSYQIDLTHSLDCDVAALLNITPDHLDRYDGFEGYARPRRGCSRCSARRSGPPCSARATPETRAIAARERARGGLKVRSGRWRGPCRAQRGWPRCRGRTTSRTRLSPSPSPRRWA
jgi:UDP-N-acetylmuramoylalanine--D-glutamate ligase